MSAPCFKESITVGSYDNPYLDKSIKTPLPKSSITGILYLSPNFFNSLISTLPVKPNIL